MSVEPQHIAADLRDLAQLWPVLHASRQRARRRPHAQAQPNPERTAAIAALIRQERADRDPANGWTGKMSAMPDPVNWHAVAVLAAGTNDLLWLEHEIRENLHDGQRLGETPDARAPRRATQLVAHPDPLPDVLAAVRYLTTAVWRVRDDTLLGETGRQVRGVLRDTRSALGDPPRARWMPEARCPVCDALSLYVLDPKQSSNPDKAEEARYKQAAIWCSANSWGDEKTGPTVTCRCAGADDETCPDRCYQGGRHTWLELEWPRLAEVLYRGPVPA